jgi:hypothetical protein
LEDGLQAVNLRHLTLTACTAAAHNGAHRMRLMMVHRRLNAELQNDGTRKEGIPVCCGGRCGAAWLRADRDGRFIVLEPAKCNFYRWFRTQLGK